MTARFSWRPNACAHQESAWSRLQKFAYLNSFDRSDILKVTRAARDRYSKKSVAVPAINLLKPNISSQALFQVILELDRPTYIFDKPWLWPGPLKLYNEQSVAAHLRYCPECAEYGFHTALFQLASSRRCPIHDEQLRDTCPSCGALIAYSVAGIVLLNPYGCRCGATLWPNRHHAIWDKLAPEKTAVLEDWVKWRRRLTENHLPGLLGSMWHKSDALKNGESEGLCEQLALITDAPNCVKSLVSYRLQLDGSVELVHQHLEKTQPDFDSMEEVYKLVVSVFIKTFEALSSRCRRFITDQHQSCLDSVKIAPSWVPESLTLPSCSVLTSFVRWRTFWLTPMHIGPIYSYQNIGPVYSSQLGEVARQISTVLSTIGVSNSDQFSIQRLASVLANAFLKCTLSAAYRVTTEEIEYGVSCAARAWPGIRDSMWPCWSIEVEEGSDLSSLLVWLPENGLFPLDQFSSVRHRRLVRHRALIAVKDIKQRFGATETEFVLKTYRGAARKWAIFQLGSFDADVRSNMEGFYVQDKSLNEFLLELESIDDQRTKVELKMLDQLLSVDREVANVAIDVFDDKAIAASWLANECPALGNEKPLSLMLQGKRELILDSLNQIKYGMWA